MAVYLRKVRDHLLQNVLDQTWLGRVGCYLSVAQFFLSGGRLPPWESTLVLSCWFVEQVWPAGLVWLVE